MFELFSGGGYSPHGYCLAWNPTLLYLHIASDVMIAIAYFSIPAVILVFLRRRKDPSLHGPAMLFVVFITACGLTHLMGVLTMFEPLYGLQGLMKLFTGVVSVLTAVILWKILPETLKIPAPNDLIRAIDKKDDEIAERMRTELELASNRRALAAKVDELTAANEELKEFAYAASHDLKSPANTLSLWLADFADEYKDRLDDEARDSIDEVAKIVARMRALVEDILSYSRVVSSDISKPETVKLSEIVEETVHDMREDIESANAEIVVGPLPEFSGYPLMIRVIMTNLMSNALKFRQNDRPPKIEITARIVDGSNPVCVVSFKDNGIGIDPKFHDKIFSLFKRLHHADTYQGTGLGLALCRRAVASHGGAIKLVSTEGAGTEFLISFPMELAHAREAA